MKKRSSAAETADVFLSGEDSVQPKANGKVPNLRSEDDEEDCCKCEQKGRYPPNYLNIRQGGSDKLT